MRLFVGVELDDTSRAAAAKAADALQRRLGRVAPRLDARWVAAPNLHITVWFIGEVDEPRVASIEAALAPPFGVAAFDLSIAGFGAFPPAGTPRVFWLGVREGAEQMAALYRETAARFVPLGFEAERRAYTAHLTVARVKDAPRGSVRAIREALAAVPAKCGSSRVSAVTLFRSRLSPKGATYEPRLRVPLS